MKENVEMGLEKWTKTGTISFWNQLLSSKGLPAFKEILISYSTEIGSKDKIESYLSGLGGKSLINCTPCQLNNARSFPVTRRGLAQSIAEYYVRRKLNKTGCILDEGGIYAELFLN